MSPGPLDKSLCFAGIGHQALLGPEDALVHSTATLRILASMPSRTIGEWPSTLAWAGLQVGICVAQSWALHPPPSRLLPRGPAQPRAASLGSKNDSRVTGIKIGSWEPSGA